MAGTDPKLEKKLATLKKDVAGLKADVDWFKDVLLKVDIAEQAEKDKEELKKIEAQME